VSGIETIADQVFVLAVAEGYFSTSILFALLQLDVFELIGEGSVSSAQLASQLGAEPEYLGRLLNAGVVVGLLESDDGTSYRLSRPSKTVLVKSAGEKYLGDWIRNMDMFRTALASLPNAVLAGTPTVDPAAHLGSGAQETRDFTLAMHNYAALRGRELARFLDTSGAQSLLDLGCGPGTYAFHLGSANPDLDLYLLDSPGVLDVAREVQGRFDLRNDVHYLPLDVTREEIPGSYDIVLVSNTLHMLGEANSRALIQRLHDHVNEGGSLVIQAQFLKDDHLGGRWPVFLDLIQMCITEHGRNHSVAETRQWMADAGFRDIEYQPMGLANTNSFLRGFR
jgi:SAM-dependent methyltransferase